MLKYFRITVWNAPKYAGNWEGNEQVASFLAPLGEEPGASRDLALWPIWDFDP